MAKYRIVEERCNGVVRYTVQYWKPLTIKQNWWNIFRQKIEWVYGWSDYPPKDFKSLSEAEEFIEVLLERDEETKNNYRKPVKEYG